MFNCKIVNYGNEIEYRFYDKPLGVCTGSKKEHCFSENKKENCCSENKKEKKEVNKNRSLLSSYNRTKNKIYDYARSNVWEWFVTLTFNGAKLDRYDYSMVTKKLSKWLNNLKSRKCPNMKYLAVPEQHADGAWHFHILMSNIDELDFIFSNRYSVGKYIYKDNKITEKIKKNGKKIYNIGSYKWGWSTATKIVDTVKASNYITKYVTKNVCQKTENKRRYWNSKNLKIPTVTDMLLGYKDLIKLKIELKKHPCKSHYKSVSIDFQNYYNNIEYITIKKEKVQKKE